MLAHVLDDIAVADGRARKREPKALQVALKAKVAHHGGDQAAGRKLAAPMPGLGNHGHELIAIDDLALLVDDHDAVGVTVKRYSDVGANLAYLRYKRVQCCRPALVVDVSTVGIDANLDDLGAKLP